VFLQGQKNDKAGIVMGASVLFYFSKKICLEVRSTIVFLLLNLICKICLLMTIKIFTTVSILQLVNYKKSTFTVLSILQLRP
jgi:hypothetical protein